MSTMFSVKSSSGGGSLRVLVLRATRLVLLRCWGWAEVPAHSGPCGGHRPVGAAGGVDVSLSWGAGRVHPGGMSTEHEVGPADTLTPGTVTGAGPYAVGNSGGELFAVSRRCRHFGADLAGGKVDEQGRLVCPWHQSAYDVHTGRMVRGPQGVFAKIPGLGAVFRGLTRVLPLRRGTVVERDGCLYVR